MSTPMIPRTKTADLDPLGAPPSFGISPFRAKPRLRLPTAPTGPGRGRPSLDRQEMMRRWSLPSGKTMPDPHHWAAQIARCSLEAIEGLRAPGQLSRWLHQDLFQALQKRAVYHQLHTRQANQDTKLGPVQVKLVRLCPTPGGAQEASVVLFDGQRSRAVALRLEAYRGRWLTTALEIV